MMKRCFLTIAALVAMLGQVAAQEFFNLTAAEVKIDSLLPVFTWQKELGANYADSVYEVTIDYPEFIDMNRTDVARLRAITTRELPDMPQVSQHVSVSRKEGVLEVSFVPLVCRDGKLQKLVSFQLSVRALPVSRSRGVMRRVVPFAERYAAHSVLASGTWAKISVPETGIYQLTNDLIRQAGFSDPSKVKVYGYGGALQPESLTGEYLQRTDDLKEVPTCTVGGRRLFHAVGPVNWSSATNFVRSRNNYSQYGYYFLTESDEAPLTQDSATFVSSFYPSANDYHTLYEKEEFSWFEGGRKLFCKDVLSFSRDYIFTLDSPYESATLNVVMTCNGPCEAQVVVNDSVVGTIAYHATLDEYSLADSIATRFRLTGMLRPQNTIAFRQTSGSNVSMRLDYAVLTFSEPKPLPNLTTDVLPVPEYVYNITNQDLHADEAIDMLIIIPTTQKLREQAERLKALHEERDGLRVRIIPADELFNEFSSGTPDANAYRRYLKMQYDRAATVADMPSYLLLMGDCAWDNRMLVSEWSTTSPDDFLLCYESDNSFSHTRSFVSDDFFALLDDNEEVTDPATGNNLGKPDVAVGRFPTVTAADAKIIVDKTIDYYDNANAGAWQNTICFLADDGNGSNHMRHAETIINDITSAYDAFNIKKIYWDAYNRVTTSTGNSYPDVTRLVKQQMQEGALIFNYTGHGAPYCMSHEQVLKRADFAEVTSARLPLWVTASCDIMPFDGQEENIGETAMLNKNGGAIAFYGTARTVYMSQNLSMNRSFMKFVLGTRQGKRISVGEAVRLAKNEMVTTKQSDLSDLSTNKLQYALLGDPALVLAAPTIMAQIDSINGKSVSAGTQYLSAGQTVKVVGHIPDNADFNGIVTATVYDVEERIRCKLNNPDEKVAVDTALVFTDRPSTIFIGSDSVRDGRFSLTFAVPKDIRYSDESGLLRVYAVNSAKTLEAHGEQEGFVMGSTDETANDGIGPSIYCYLNSSSFTNGGTVNATPYFYAELTDKDGINAAGSSIGHDLELIVDGEISRTYNLNSYFQYNFGDYRSGTVGYSLPELAAGQHKLLFRAWDVLNNSSTAELSFYVDPGQTPSLISVICTRNPASTGTSFVINHDRSGSQMDVTLEVFDTSGRKLWQRTETGIPTSQTYVVNWDLTVDSGSRLHTGVYLYRVLVSSGGSQTVSPAKKLIVLGNN